MLVALVHDPQNSDRATEMTSQMMRPLEQVLAGAPEIKNAQVIGDAKVLVSDITHDSSSVSSNSIFCCVVGEHSDGHDFANLAHKNGAVALLVERKLDLDVTQILVEDVRTAMGYLASELFNRPSQKLNVIGVTGTNGKTTTAHLLAAILAQHGWQTTVFGTLSGTRTTPESTDLQRKFSAELASGCKAVVMEVSSHALMLHRVEGTKFAAAIFTNLGQDHLDFHGSLEDYFSAKARLFSAKFTENCIINRDDVHGSLLIDALASEKNMNCETFGLDDVQQIDANISKISFIWKGQKIEITSGGHFNVMNALAAATAAAKLGVTVGDIAKGLAAASAVPGRFESVNAGQSFGVVIDYAHTPEALQKVLLASRDLISSSAKVFVVFGCGGNRDHSKRSKMGEMATKFADTVIVTSDNPRTEDPQKIADEILQGVDSKGDVLVNLDRRSAIARAFSLAKSGDIVVIAGKGHETTQSIGDKEIDFSDAQVSRELLGVAS